MASRIGLAAVCVVSLCLASAGRTCCPAPPSGKPVVNADQTVILIWDAANQTQHFIRKATFQSEADDFGFIVPCPSQPELEESGDGAFPYLLKLTEPEVKRAWRLPISVPSFCCCAPCLMNESGSACHEMVTVLQEKEVAGFNAVVLEATSAAALTGWLKAHGYAFSPEVEAWAKPYVESGWKFTALKIAKGLPGSEKAVAAASLRISFRTERPLFPYREPDPNAFAEALGARHRLLRIYFIAEARYRGELTKEQAWTGKVAWAGQLAPESRQKLLELLKLSASTGPATWWLTEFEDHWPYQAAPADVYFARDPGQEPVRRPPIIRYYVSSGWSRDGSVYALAAVVVVPPVVRRVRRSRRTR
jgi:hypothetical protein